MARLNPQMLKSYLDQSQDDIASPDYEESDDYLEESSEDLAESLHGGDYEGFMKMMFDHAHDIQQAASKTFLTSLDEQLSEDVKGEIKAAMLPVVTPRGDVVLASDAGELLVVGLDSGQVIERVNLNQPLSAGVGSDGVRHAVITRDNVLVVEEPPPWL